MTFLRIGAFVASSLLMSAAGAATVVSTFDDLLLAPNSHDEPGVSTSFTSGAASFNHDFTDYGFGCCSSGWTYTNETDTTTAGYTNQYSAITGGGAQGSANYAVAFLGAPVISLGAASAVDGFYVTNTTYTALSVLEGDMFAKKFGGASGNDADYLRLTITGLDAASHETGSVDFYLADYRFSDNSQDYVVKQWTFVDLSSLGSVAALKFSMASSDNGDFGMNTPSYFAIDNLSVSAVPEADTIWMVLAGLAGAAALRRRSAR